LLALKLGDLGLEFGDPGLQASDLGPMVFAGSFESF